MLTERTTTLFVSIFYFQKCQTRDYNLLFPIWQGVWENYFSIFLISYVTWRSFNTVLKGRVIWPPQAMKISCGT